LPDEVQCGQLQNGKYFASEYWKDADAAPDIVATGQVLSGGVPIKLNHAREEIMDSVIPGTIAETYCGKPAGLLLRRSPSWTS
jgi:4-aminobutyrate aminotransferase/(S)-3-amino-2-methylpropionate transaminase